jgi:thioredoxin reductase (NADPH)
VQGLVVANTSSDAKRTLAVDGVFVEIGYAVNADIVKGLVMLNENNEVITDRDGNTTSPGIYGCGDVTNSTYKQAIIAAGDGAKAALSAYFYINKGAKVVPDWRH